MWVTNDGEFFCSTAQWWLRRALTNTRGAVVVVASGFQASVIAMKIFPQRAAKALTLRRWETIKKKKSTS
jgi:hypothetical protein